MGAQQTTRRLTIDNEDPTNVIKVSDAVVERLRGSNEGVRPNLVRQEGAVDPPTIPITPAGMPGVPPRFPAYMYEPLPTSLQVRQDRDSLLRTNDAYWQGRINKLEETHEQINKLMDDEYNDAVHEVKSNFAEIPKGRREPLCVEGKQAVMSCYRKHPKEPMKCAQLVQDFADCVDRQRAAIVAKRG